MADYIELTERLSQRITKLIHRLETSHADAITSLKGRMEGVVPEVDLPRPGFLEELPTAKDFTRANFALAEQILRAQKSYTLGLLDAIAKPPKRSKRARRAKSEDVDRAA